MLARVGNWVGLVLVSSALSAACGQTAITIELRGALAIPADFNAAEVQVTRAPGAVDGSAGGTWRTELIYFSGADGLPFQLAIEPGMVPLGEVTLKVTAFRTTTDSADPERVVVASGTTTSAFELRRVNHAVVELTRPGCSDDPFEALDDDATGATINPALDTALPVLALCPGDERDRFNFTVPASQWLSIIVDRYEAEMGTMAALEGALTCTTWDTGDEQALDWVALGFGAEVGVDPAPAPRTCVLDVQREGPNLDAAFAYGFATRLQTSFDICVDDGRELYTLEALGGGESAPVVTWVGEAARLCPGNQDDYTIVTEPGRLLWVSVGPPGGGAPFTSGVAGLLKCLASSSFGTSTTMPLLARTLSAVPPPIFCDLGLVDLAGAGLDYQLTVEVHALDSCPTDAAGANHTLSNALDLAALPGLSPTNGGTTPTLAVCSNEPDIFYYDWSGSADALFVHVDAAELVDGDVDLCVLTPDDGAASTGPYCTPVRDLASEVQAINPAPPGHYQFGVACGGAPCGNVYTLTITPAGG